MKLTTFRLKAEPNFESVGAVVGEHNELIVDLVGGYEEYLTGNRKGAKEERALGGHIPRSMMQLMEGGDSTLQACRNVVSYALKSFKQGKPHPIQKHVHNTGDAVLQAPLPFPRLIMDFAAFEQHMLNSREKSGLALEKEWYDMPVCYKKNPGSVIGPEANVVRPKFTKRLDYELELAVYIGRKGKNFELRDAFSYVFGYSAFNDFSARDMQAKETRVRLGPFKSKDFDTAGALGPWIVTSDELRNPQNLEMTARVNGQEWSRGNTKDLYWTIPELVAYAAYEETLYPGYVLGTGPVGFGCGYELDRFLEPGDLVELQIDKIGTLRNRISRARPKP